MTDKEIINQLKIQKVFYFAYSWNINLFVLCDN